MNIVWQTLFSITEAQGGMLGDSILTTPPPTPRLDPASVPSIFRLHYYLFRADSGAAMGLITP